LNHPTDPATHPPLTTVKSEESSQKQLHRNGSII
jgi:hypothetical protein